MSPPSRTPLGSPTEATQGKDKAPAKSRKCLIFFGLHDFEVRSLWMHKSREFSAQQHSRHMKWKCESTTAQE
jgi:hypothetical protein